MGALRLILLLLRHHLIGSIAHNPEIRQRDGQSDNHHAGGGNQCAPRCYSTATLSITSYYNARARSTTGFWRLILSTRRSVRRAVVVVAFGGAAASLSSEECLLWSLSR